MGGVLANHRALQIRALRNIQELRRTPGGGIPGWNDSLVMTTLKDGTVYRVDLTPDGRDVNKVTKLITEQNRFRDAEFSADGKSLFVAADTAGPVRDAQGAPATGPLQNPGSIIEYRWRP
ncbi:Glucose / Sorbosone dehydrogenase [Streptomyces sp. AmelKG-E11A]|nr:Glucose / Sorbosone dehydrogenase [Streptomyces sp. AmelKG-E11A]